MSTSRPSDAVVPLAERGQAFLHRARGLRGLAPHQLARVARRLEAPRPRRQRRALVRALAAAALVLTAGTAVAWASGALERLPGVGALFGRAKGVPHAPSVTPSPVDPGAPSAEIAGPEPGIAPGTSGRVVPEMALDTTGDPALPAPAAEAPGALPGPARQEPASLLRARAHRRKATVAAPPASTPAEPADNPIVLEGRSFARALELWRARRDAPAALSALDEHERRFAGGQMRAEALVLRAEILLAGHRDREALAALDQVPLDRVPRGRELRTLRGELRARFGRCEEARADLTPVSGGADAHARRAQEALAWCP